MVLTLPARRSARLPVVVSIRVLGLASAVAVVALAAGAGAPDSAAGAPGSSSGIHKIKHVVVIMQENRSFDSYFGTFPGADGIPMQDGQPAVCVPDPASGACVAPYPDHADVNGGGPQLRQRDE